jgi:hypothetical protein
MMLPQMPAAYGSYIAWTTLLCVAVAAITLPLPVQSVPAARRLAEAGGGAPPACASSPCKHGGASHGRVCH